MFTGIFNLLKDILTSLVSETVFMFVRVHEYASHEGYVLDDLDFNLTLFSDTPILSMNMYELLNLFFSIFYGMFFIVLIYKVTKKVINKVLGVLKW